MRIIAGEFRGRPLKAPKGNTTRPTTDRIKESMMSSLNSRTGGFEGLVVLDAFAGSGGLGLETLSRGAASVLFCEQDRHALDALTSNIATLKLSPLHARVRRGDVLKNVPLTAGPFDLVLLDPPYAYPAEDVLAFLTSLHEGGALSPEVVVMYEHAASNKRVPEVFEPSFLEIVSSKKCGDITVCILEMKQGEK